MSGKARPKDNALEAFQLRSGRVWYVRPKDILGTCGWINGHAWTIVRVIARSEHEAVRKARGMVWR